MNLMRTAGSDIKHDVLMEANRESVLVEKTVTYALEVDGRIYLVEQVPARVNPETGEQFFSPKTVSVLQSIFSANVIPERVIETPVYNFLMLGEVK